MLRLCAIKRSFYSVGLSLIVLTILAACTSAATPAPTIPASIPFLPTIALPTPTPTVVKPVSVTLTSPPTPIPTDAMYSFEEYYSGWDIQAYYSARACIRVSNSSDVAKDGRSALKLDMDLLGNDERNSRGEAWVDMRYYSPPIAENPFRPLDLNNRTITMWVYAPIGAIGDSSKPNGLQVFVKDARWKGSYSTWVNVVENEWVQLSFTVSSSEVEGGYLEQGFDPTQIIAVGIKMAAGGGSTTPYKGSIYVDAVDW